MIRLLPILLVAFVSIMSCDTKTVVNNQATSQPETDSAKVVLVLENLLQSCWQCPNDGNCSKTASFIVYRGRSEPDRAWKSLADYSKEEDRKIVDEACSNIKKVMPEGTKYRIAKFLKEKESEGVWHVLTIIPDKKTDDGKIRYVEFAFLNIGRQFALGDLDGYTYR